jgi:hypothetical protein
MVNNSTQKKTHVVSQSLSLNTKRPWYTNVYGVGNPEPDLRRDTKINNGQSRETQGTQDVE